jgi:hypothetical protein
MNKDDIKERANRCRLMAGTADAFTKRRLLDLASKYEARLAGPSPAANKITKGPVANENSSGRQRSDSGG